MTLLLTLISLSACGTTEVITEYKTVPVPVYRYVAVPDDLTWHEAPHELPHDELPDMTGREVLFTLRDGYLIVREQAMQCFEQLDRIAELGND